MITQGRLAHHQRTGGFHDTRNELPLQRTNDNTGTGVMWSAIGACAFMLLVLFMVGMSARDPIHALQVHTEQVDQ